MKKKKPYQLIKRSVSLDGHRTSVALEQLFWDEVDLLAKTDRLSVSGWISHIDRQRPADQSLASALRVKVLTSLKEQSGH
ncbi:MAG: ribbon-helix-helix domain-containing protein [Pseudomonadota bacterium]